MKKLSAFLMLALFTFFACQTDTALENDPIESKRSVETVKFNPIPDKFVEDPERYVNMQLENAPKDGQYGCITIIDGIVYFDCTIVSGVPRDYRDCDLKGVRYIECGVWADNPFCIVCAVAYILECDGELGWVLGYDIVCDYSLPVQPYPL
jgi:hypothetical protein